MIVSSQTTVRLSQIVGTSPLNPRPHPGTDLDGLAASIVAAGLLQPLLVVARAGSTEEHPAYETLDGSRRWHALQRVHDIETTHCVNPDVPVVILTGTEAELREVALAANFHRLDLHPVERYEAFAALVKAGMSLEQISRDFHMEQRDIRKALALGALHADVRAVWKAGDLDADQAAAFTTGDQGAQAKLLRDVLANHLAPKEIRARLRGDAVPGTDPRALFAETDYLDAGGRIDENLFEDGTFFRDAKLLDKVSREKLQALADTIARDEGWGVAAIERDGFAPDGHLRPAYLVAEQTRVDELAALLEADDFETDADAKRIADELDAIDRRAILRAVPQAARARYGVFVEIDQIDGSVIVTRGLALAQGKAQGTAQEPAGGASDQPREPRAPRNAGTPQQPVADEPPSSRALRAVLDTAIETAFTKAVARRPDVAIMLALAHLAANGQYNGLRIIAAGCRLSETAPLLVKAVDKRDFPLALSTLAAAENLDCVTGFAYAVAASIDVRDLPLAALQPLVDAMAARCVVLGADLDAALDRFAYFKAATREAALDVIRELLGEAAAAEALAKKKTVIAEEAARVATDRRWLPAPLDRWAAATPGGAVRERSSEASASERSPERVDIAKAMNDAIEADTEGRTVERFLHARTRRADGALVNASKLHEAFVSWCIDEGIGDVPALRPFGAIMTRLGHERHRRAEGSQYRHIVLRDAAVLQTAAE